MSPPIITRRNFLHLGSLGAGALALSACALPVPPNALPALPPTTEPVRPTTEPVSLTEAPTATLLPPTTVPLALFNGISQGITAEGFPYLGDPNAPVTMIDYSDFL